MNLRKDKIFKISSQEIKAYITISFSLCYWELAELMPQEVENYLKGSFQNCRSELVAELGACSHSMIPWPRGS